MEWETRWVPELLTSTEVTISLWPSIVYSSLPSLRLRALIWWSMPPAYIIDFSWLNLTVV